jgi:hypothetical protein
MKVRMTELFGTLAARYKAANIAFPSLKYVAIENTKAFLNLGIRYTCVRNGIV